MKKLINNIIIIIPALEKNKYFKKGDLSGWGGTNLLEWKISQAKNIKYVKDIFVYTPSVTIQKICKNLNINFIKRSIKFLKQKNYKGTVSIEYISQNGKQLKNLSKIIKVLK